TSPPTRTNAVSYLSFLFTSSHSSLLLSLFFFNDTPTTEIYTLSLHDALPICIDLLELSRGEESDEAAVGRPEGERRVVSTGKDRSEEHTSELQSLTNLVCRLLLEKKKKQRMIMITSTQNSLTIAA